MSNLPSPDRDGTFSYLLRNGADMVAKFMINLAGLVIWISAGSGYEWRDASGNTIATLSETGAWSPTGFVIPSASVAPSAPGVGQVYFNTVDVQFYGWDGGQWVILG